MFKPPWLDERINVSFLTHTQLNYYLNFIISYFNQNVFMSCMYISLTLCYIRYLIIAKTEVFNPKGKYWFIFYFTRNFFLWMQTRWHLCSFFVKKKNRHKDAITITTLFDYRRSQVMLFCILTIVWLSILFSLQLFKPIENEMTVVQGKLKARPIIFVYEWFYKSWGIPVPQTNTSISFILFKFLVFGSIFSWPITENIRPWWGYLCSCWYIQFKQIRSYPPYICLSHRNLR